MADLTEAQKALLRRAMDAQQILNPSTRAGIAAIVGGESGFRPRTEEGYGGTSNARIRRIFTSRVSSLDDAALDALKRDDGAFFETVYGGAWGRKNLGNTEPGDGFRYRGRGFCQLTGRGNYVRYGKLLGLRLVSDPDLANDPEAAAAIICAYIRDRYKGGGWPALKAAVGTSIGNVDARKNALYQQFLASGEFAAAK